MTKPSTVPFGLVSADNLLRCTQVAPLHTAAIGFTLQKFRREHPPLRSIRARAAFRPLLGALGKMVILLHKPLHRALCARVLHVFGKQADPSARPRDIPTPPKRARAYSRYWSMYSVACQILCSVSSVTLSPVITRSSRSFAIRSKNLPIRAIRSRISAVSVPDLARCSIVFSSAPEGRARFRNSPPLDRYSSTSKLISLIVIMGRSTSPSTGLDCGVAESLKANAPDCGGIVQYPHDQQTRTPAACAPYFAIQRDMLASLSCRLGLWIRQQSSLTLSLVHLNDLTCRAD